MKVRNMFAAVLFSFVSVSAFAQGKTLAEREADLARREAAVKEAELAQREAAVAEREKALNGQQAEAQPVQAEGPAWKRPFRAIGRGIRNASDKAQSQVEVTVAEVGSSTIRATTDEGVTRYCNVNVLDRKVEANGTKAKIKNDHFAACSTAAPTSMAGAVTADEGGVGVHQPVTAVSVTLSRGGMLAIETGGIRQQWKCKPSELDKKRPGTGALVTWTDIWSAKDFADRECKTYTGK